LKGYGKGRGSFSALFLFREWEVNIVVISLKYCDNYPRYFIIITFPGCYGFKDGIQFH
jgi:hypothetical protein